MMLNWDISGFENHVDLNQLASLLLFWKPCRIHIVYHFAHQYKLLTEYHMLIKRCFDMPSTQFLGTHLLVLIV